MLVLCIYAVVQNYNILKQDSTIFYYDIADTYTISKSLYALFEKHDFKAFGEYYLNRYYKDYPPLIVFQPFPIYYVLGLSEDNASLSNIVHVCIILFSIFYLGKKVRDRKTGLLSALFLFSVPSFLPFSRVYLPDIALVSIFSLSTVVYYYSEFFSNTKYSLLFGAICGLGMLAKFTFFIYIIPLVFIGFIYRFFQYKTCKKINSRQFIFNISISILACLAVMSIWYLPHGTLLLSIQQGETGFDNGLNFAKYNLLEKLFINLLQYTKLLFSVKFLGLCAFFFIPIFSYSLLRLINGPNIKTDLIEIILAPVFIIFPLLLFSSSARYVFPLLILFSVTSAELINKIIDTIRCNKFTHRIINGALFILLFALACTLPFKGSIMSTNNLYEKGIVMPSDNFLPVQTMISEINELIINNNVSRAVFLHDSIAASAIGNNINTSIYNPIQELTRSHMCRLSAKCDAALHSSKVFICNSDIVITSNITIPFSLLNLVEDALPDKLLQYQKVQDNFENCKDNFEPILNYSHVIIDDGESADIVVHLNKKNYLFISK
ncbi:MAG: glycosyltransferase family 39 protein [archaeon]